MARFNLISNISNGVGLQRDYEMLRSILETAGHQVRGVQFNACHATAPAEVNVFLETVVPLLFQTAPKNWLIPNPEWFDPQWRNLLGNFSRVLCKTRDSLRIFRQMAIEQSLPTPVEHLGWQSRDFFDDSIPRERKFLHVAGNSAYKNTTSILWAWGTGRMTLPVTIISEVHFGRVSVPNACFFRRVSDQELQRMMNSHLFHLCSSHYEGWGHALHEALGVGANVLTTAKPPMDEFHAAVRVNASACTQQRMAETWSVSGPEMLAGTLQMQHMSEEMAQSFSQAARKHFLEGQEFFKRRIQEVIAEVPV